MQRILLIGSQRLTTAAAASDYLRAEFAKGGKKPNAKQAARLEELATEGDAKNKVTATTLSAALQYITSGKALNLPQQFIDASVSPERPPKPLYADYTMVGTAKKLTAPQSPETRFPPVAHGDLTVDVEAEFAKERKRVDSEKAKLPTYKFGKNVFSYSTHAHIRTAPLVEKSAGGNKYQEIGGPAVFSSVSAESRLYQSKLELPPIAPKVKPVRIEKAMRDKLQGIHTKTKSHPTLKNTSLVSGKVDRGGTYFATASVNAISSLYVHSEVQAAADAADGTAQLLAKTVLDSIKAMFQTGVTQPIQVAVVAVSIIGVSEPNTVCGGACKGALSDIRDLFGTAFDAARRADKDDFKKKGIYLRSSAEYSLEFHVCGRKEFQGKGKGASVSTTAATTLGAHAVAEYDPH